MADRPAVRTLQITRDQLTRIAQNDPVLTKAFENLFLDVGTTLPDATSVNNDLIDAATQSAAAAHSEAVAAQSAADAVQAEADLLSAAEVLLFEADPVFPNGRTLAVDPLTLTLTDDAASLTIGAKELKAILQTDASDSAGMFIQVGLSLDLEANATYLVDALITFQSAATTTGIALGFASPTGSVVSGGFSHNATPTSIQGSLDSTPTTAVPAALTNIPVTGRWMVTTLSPGLLDLGFHTSVASSTVTIKAGLSSMVARRLA